MKRKKKNLLKITAASFAAVTTVCLLAVVYWDTNVDIDPEPEGGPLLNESTQSAKFDSEKSTISQVIVKNNITPTLPVRRIIGEFESAISAEEATAAIDQAYQAGELVLAQNLETDLYLRCGLIEDGFKPPFNETEWAFDNLVQYCGTYHPSVSPKELEQRSAEASVYEGTKTIKLFEEFLELDYQEAEGDFIARMANVISPQDLEIGRNLLEMLHNSGIPLSLGQDANQYSTPDQALRVNMTALRLYGCFRFNSCGPNSYQMQNVCMFSAQCNPEWSLVDYYANTLSPIEFEQVTKIFMFLYDNQIDG